MMGEGSSGATTDDVERLPQDQDEVTREGNTTAAASELEHAQMPPAPAGETGDAAREPLLPADSTNGYRSRWEQIQARFVDDPRSSVEEADQLVIEVVQELQMSFGSERQALETQWQRGDDVETEGLRVALQRYRSFFDRLLAA